ncbi:MAG: hypothetical protein AAGC68_11325 [Verrucomicrobiota bacterium]
MKEQSCPIRAASLLLTIVAAILAIPCDSEARLLRKKDIRKMSGTYPAVFRGNGSTGTTPYTVNNVSGFIFIGTRSSTTAGPSGTIHTIKFRRPKGRARKARFKGVYRGTIVNPNTNVAERVFGARVANVRKKGRGRKARYTVRFRDYITEGSYSYWRLRGRGTKR